MTDQKLHVLEFSRLHDEVEERKDRIAQLHAYAKLAKIVRFFFAIDTAVLFATYDGSLLVVCLILLLLMMTITAHIFLQAFVEEMEELEGKNHPWRRG